MNTTIQGKATGKTGRRAGTVLAVAGSAAVGMSLALDGVGGCARLAQVYLGNHNLALAMFLTGTVTVGYGVYLQVKNRARRAEQHPGSGAAAVSV